MSDPTAPPKPAYKPGDVLVVAAPASSGLPLNARAIVASVNKYDGVQHKYDVTLTGGGARGSDVQFVKGVSQGWLRSEGRIATAKSCNVLPFGTFARTAPRLLVPLFQRRYCWSEREWRQLWLDIVSPRYFVSTSNPHAIGRVVIARQLDRSPGAIHRESIVLVDGQQRCTTLMLLLCALRDVAASLDESALLVGQLNQTIHSRSAARRRLREPGSGTSPVRSDAAEARHIERGTLVASIPLSALLSNDAALAEDVGLADVAELTGSTNLAAIALWRQRELGGRWWAPYARALPQTFNTTLAWSSDELAE